MQAQNEKTWATATALFLQHANDRDEMMTSDNSGFTMNHIMEETLMATTNALQELNGQVANMSERTNSQATTITELTAKLAITDATLKAYRDGLQNRGQENRNPASREQYRSGKAYGTKYCWTHGMRGHS